MRREEAILVMIGYFVCLALALWLVLSRVWAKRRIPPRLTAADAVIAGGPILATVGGQLELTGLGREFLRERGVDDPDAFMEHEGNPSRQEARARMAGVLDGDPPDFAGAIDLARVKHPPSTLFFDQHPPRPWAHG